MTTISTYINAFAAKSGNGAFPNLPRADVVSGLKERLTDPYKINQGQASLCGPAALAYAICSKLPEMYAAYVMSLYDTGSAMLGKIRVKPHEGCRHAKVGTKISPVDWVGLASLRDSYNTDFQYDNPDKEFAGITMPGDMEDWFKALKFADVREETNLVRTKGFDNFRQAAQLYAAGYSVILFIWMDVLKGHRAGFWTTPNHWVVLNKYPTFSKDRFTAQVYTWGSNLALPTIKNGDFTAGYYGYVAGKWR